MGRDVEKLWLKIIGIKGSAEQYCGNIEKIVNCPVAQVGYCLTEQMVIVKKKNGQPFTDIERNLLQKKFRSSFFTFMTIEK
jgi:hypothetical protein